MYESTLSRDGSIGLAGLSAVRKLRTGKQLTVRDREELVKVVQAYELAINRDSQTGLLNRRGFQFYLQEAVIDAQSPTYQNDIVLAHVDLDRFRHYTNHHGRLNADRFLKRTGQYLAGTLGPTDKLAHPQDDEYLILAHNTPPDETELHNHLEAIVRGFAMTRAGDPHYPTMSIGAAILEPGVSAEEMLKRAEEALTVAKISKNAARVWTPSAMYDDIRHIVATRTAAEEDAEAPEDPLRRAS